MDAERHEAAKAKVDLHALANARGFGTAKERLREAGFWDEAADPEFRLWRVMGRADVLIEGVAGVIEVRARNAEEAKVKAREADGDDWDWFETGEVDRIEIVDVEEMIEDEEDDA